MPVMRSKTINENPALSQTDINSGYELREYDDKEDVLRYITSDAVNKHLREQGIKLNVSEEHYKVPDKFSKYSQIMLEYQLGEYDEDKYYNRPICGLFSDISPESKSVKIEPADFFDTLATFYSFPYIYRDEDDNIEFKGSSFVYNDFGVIYPLSLGRCANPIGSSTIAETADGFLLIRKQEDDATTNPGRLMPTGSGVTKWEAVENEDLDTLQDLIIVAAEHKAKDECNLPDKCEMDTKLLGMARVPTGMKPDFFCYTKLNMTSDELVKAGAVFEKAVDTKDRGYQALLDYVESRNRKVPSSASIQLYLEALLLTELQ